MDIDDIARPQLQAAYFLQPTQAQVADLPTSVDQAPHLLHQAQSQAAQFPPLSEEVRAYVPTDCAAYHLNRRPQTLREWASLDIGLCRPIRIGRRLGWRTADLRRILGVEVAT